MSLHYAILNVLNPLGHGLAATEVVAWDVGSITLKFVDGTTYKKSGGTVSWRCSNPGNIKFGDFAKSCGAIGSGQNSDAVFPTLAQGRAAQIKLLFDPSSRYYSLNLLEAIAIYAPADDHGPGAPEGGNDPTQYAYFVAKDASVSLREPLSEFSAVEQGRIVDSMTKFEGFKVGTSVKL